MGESVDQISQDNSSIDPCYFSQVSSYLTSHINSAIGYLGMCSTFTKSALVVGGASAAVFGLYKCFGPGAKTTEAGVDDDTRTEIPAQLDESRGAKSASPGQIKEESNGKNVSVQASSEPGHFTFFRPSESEGLKKKHHSLGALDPECSKRFLHAFSKYYANIMSSVEAKTGTLR
jgi:hypothetical protein